MVICIATVYNRYSNSIVSELNNWTICIAISFKDKPLLYTPCVLKKIIALANNRLKVEGQEIVMPFD